MILSPKKMISLRFLLQPDGKNRTFWPGKSGLNYLQSLLVMPQPMYVLTFNKYVLHPLEMSKMLHIIAATRDL